MTTSFLCLSLHWLPIAQGIRYKINSLCYHCITCTAPSYLCICFNFTHPPVLSALLLILSVSRFLVLNFLLFGSWAFSVFSPSTCNGLSILLRQENFNTHGCYRSKYLTQVHQQRPELPMVTFTWHSCKYEVHKLHQRYILHFRHTTKCACNVGYIYHWGGILLWWCTSGGVYAPCIYMHARWGLP